MQPAAADDTSVPRFVLACLPRASGAKETWGTIYTSYVSWCAEQLLTPLHLDAFGPQFAATCERLNIPIRKRKGQAFCVGVRLVA